MIYNYDILVMIIIRMGRYQTVLLKTSTISGQDNNCRLESARSVSRHVRDFVFLGEYSSNCIRYILIITIRA